MMKVDRFIDLIITTLRIVYIRTIKSYINVRQTSNAIAFSTSLTTRIFFEDCMVISVSFANKIHSRQKDHCSALTQNIH